MILRTRNLPNNGPGVIEQVWTNDNQTAWEWRRVPLVPTDAPIKGEGPPPISGDQQQESS